jgi:hypothetical protein
MPQLCCFTPFRFYEAVQVFHSYAALHYAAATLLQAYRSQAA